MKCPNCQNEHIEIDNNEKRTCLDCGFYTEKGYNILNKFVIFQSIPELFKDLCVEAEDQSIWFPTVLNWEDVGILFPDGKNKDEWEWVVAPSINIPKEVRKNFPVKGQPGKYHKTKISFKDSIKFGKNFKLAMTFLFNLKNKED